ncbi:hypothetical protein L3Q82_014921 [Scortum barcoo]|uniref:Uncharacterized protein n=1 Tax=Scortum barcoo TaxID=214431 RepID=A0ACB8VUB4_9TELE|nr:hypothetical protein L3Q82_014921 [Scortum barcoo]
MWLNTCFHSLSSAAAHASCRKVNSVKEFPVLQRLSCMARRYKLYVVANMADLQPCPLKSDPSSILSLLMDAGSSTPTIGGFHRAAVKSSTHWEHLLDYTLWTGRYALQVCALVRCAGLDISSCGQEVEEAESKMDFLLEGKFGTKYVYPSVLASKMVLEQPEHLEMAPDGRVNHETLQHDWWAEPLQDSSYVAAVYEHSVILNPEPGVPLSRPAALQHLRRNLEVYEEQAARAAEQKCNEACLPSHLPVVRVPRSWCFQKMVSRVSTSAVPPSLANLETIPDPQQESWNPCTEPDKYNNTEVLQRLSCMARRYKLYVVANMADLQPCPLKSDPSSSCPPDGRWQFNTNVVFRSDGLLVARYHKYNLYFEEAFDTPPQPEIITFDTPFAGRFGLFICFDILFQQPTVTLVERGVRQLIFPTAWMNQLPLLDTIQFQQALSLGANVTLLAANIRNDRLIMTGSGIYTPFSATYHHAQRGDPEEGRLLVARVPVLDPLWSGKSVSTEEGVVREETTSATDSGFCHQESCFDSSPSSVSPSSTTFTSSMMYDPFTFVLLHETEGKVNVCNGTFCCHLQYQQIPQSSSKELYALGAFAGTHIVNGRYALQVCALVRCAGLDISSCGQEVEEAESKIDFLLEGKFGTKYVYPSVLASKMVLEQPEHLEMAAGWQSNHETLQHDWWAGHCLFVRTNVSPGRPMNGFRRDVSLSVIY